MPRKGGTTPPRAPSPARSVGGSGKDRPQRVPAPHFMEECPAWAVPRHGVLGGPGMGWTVQGHSTAGERTGFYIKELQLGLDAGCNTYKTLTNILLTHSHSDHSFNVPCIAMGPAPYEQRPMIFVPGAVEAPLRLLCRASGALNSCYTLTDAAPQEIRATSVEPGKTFRLGCGRAGRVPVDVQVVECVHSVPCCGYILGSVTSRLKEEYKGMSGKELGALRKGGTAISEDVSVPALAFLGDTDARVFERSRNPTLLDCPVIMVECTGMGKMAVETMRARGHMHWLDMAPVVEANPGVTFVLMHFTRAYSDPEVAAYFVEQATTAAESVEGSGGSGDSATATSVAPSSATAGAETLTTGGAGGGGGGDGDRDSHADADAGRMGGAGTAGDAPSDAPAAEAADAAVRYANVVLWLDSGVFAVKDLVASGHFRASGSAAAAAEPAEKRTPARAR